MTYLEIAEQIAERLRRQPWIMFKNNCFTNSLRLKSECKSLGIQARVVICIGLGETKWFGHWRTIPTIHGCCEVEGRRIETSRPLGASGILGIVSMNIKPVVAIWI